MNDLRARVEATYDLASASLAWRETYETACRTLDTIRELEDLVRSDGLVSTGSTGQTVIHPALVELRQQRAAYARLVKALDLADDDRQETRRKAQARAARERWRG